MINFDTYQNLLKILISFLKEEFGSDFLSCALFGSVARGQARPLSDIDLIIVCRKGNRSPFNKFAAVLRKLRTHKEYKKLEKKGFFT